MPCFTFYIFNRKGACQYYHEWQARRGPLSGGGRWTKCGGSSGSAPGLCLPLNLPSPHSHARSG